MDYKERLFERFGKQLIEAVRDKQIHHIDAFLDQNPHVSVRYKEEIDTLTPEQLEMIKEMAVRWVDGTLHDLLYLLENSDWIKLRLESDEGVLEDIRQGGFAD